MEGGLNLLVCCTLVLALIGVVALMVAYDRQRLKLDRAERKHAGLERIVEQANDAIVVLDFVSGRIYHANPRAAAMLGHNVDTLLGMTVFDLHFPEDLHRSAERIADVWSSGGLVYDDIPFRTAQGGSVPVECSGKVTEFQGRPAVVIQARDISVRLRLQKEIAEKNALVEQHNSDMRSGLRYAQGIQTGMLPTLQELRVSFADVFVINRPRDIVSGDFYWSARVGSKVVLAVADCTGHGVPGALLSMTGIALLQQVVGAGTLSPDRVLGEMRTELLRTLAHQEGGAQLRDGMSVGLLIVDRGAGCAAFSGALCPLYVLRKGGDVLEVIKGDRSPVGFHDGIHQPFERHSLELEAGDRLYMASDGFPDQFGGPLGKKFKSGKLRDLLIATGQVPLKEQGLAMDAAFVEWCGDLPQVDDVLLVGMEI